MIFVHHIIVTKATPGASPKRKSFSHLTEDVVDDALSDMARQMTVPLVGILDRVAIPPEHRRRPRWSIEEDNIMENLSYLLNFFSIGICCF
jgi:hypothetical protein